jgi:hypothetical protein
VRPEIDLSLLRDSLVQLKESTYFGVSLHQFTSMLIDVIDHVLGSSSLYSDTVVRGFADNIRQSQHYLSGSTTKETPYEIAFCLEQATKDWVKRSTIITTGLTYGHDFHFRPSDPLKFIKLSVTGFPLNGYEPKLIYIGVPRLYVHKPLYCIPLYHELGHFVDNALGVTNISFLIAPVPSATPANVQQTQILHRMEFFADLFCACYVGRAGIETLKTIAASNLASWSHPATSERVSLVEDFLAGRPSRVVELFQQSLGAVGAPSLAARFDRPDVTASFSDIRPYDISSVRELHGLFSSAWEYLIETLDSKPGWAAGAADARIELIINDLTEKSLRNFAIMERWARGATE